MSKPRISKGFAADINAHLPKGFEAQFIKETQDLLADYIAINRKGFLQREVRVAVVYEDENGVVQIKLDPPFDEILKAVNLAKEEK